MRSRRSAIVKLSLVLWLLAVICGEAHPALAANQKPTPDASRPFTVADSIAMTHFEVPDEYAPANPPMSPDGKKFFVVTEKGIVDKNLREYALLVYDFSSLSRPATVVTFQSSSNRPAIAQAQWLDEQHISLIGEQPSGMPQVYVLNCRTGTTKRLTAEPLGVQSYAVSRDQRKLLYYPWWGAALPDDKYKDEHGFAVTDELLPNLANGSWRKHLMVSQLHILDTVTGQLRVAKAQTLAHVPPAIGLSPNGRYAVTEQVPLTVPDSWESYEDPLVKRYTREWSNSKLKPIGLAETVIIDTETAKMRPLTGTPSSVNGVTSVVWSNDSNSIAVAGTYLPLDTNNADETARRKRHPVMAAVEPANGSIERVVDIADDEDWQITPGPLPDSLTVIAWKRGPGGDFIGKCAPRTFRYQAAGWAEEKTIIGERKSKEITLRQALNQWPVLVERDVTTKEETVILDPNPQFRQFRFGKAEVVNWTGKLGESLTGGLVYPTGYVPGTRYPLVIQTHGFSPQNFLLDGPFTTAMAAQELANKGVAVLQLPESGIARVNCDRGPGAVSQLESAIDYLDTAGLIDRARVGLVGFSMTGFDVRYALVNSNYDFAAATSAEGNDWGYWSYIIWGNWGAFTAQNECPYGGPPWGQNWERWMKKSISFHYDRIRTPLRLESDRNDENEENDILNSWENFIALKRLHKPVELIYVAKGHHPVLKPWDRLTSQQGNVDWMLFWLKSEEDPEPSKREQYVRWRALRKLQQSQSHETEGSGN